jgi:mono/diheme cytochrome c family protein
VTRRFFTKRTASVSLGILSLLVLGFLILGWRRAFPQIDPPAANSFEPLAVAHGAQLAAIGDCGTCHTAPGGAAFAGGRALPTPFGTIYSTNITPDPNTGIGRWSQRAFRRAMREGIDRDGRHLYPAFPFDHYTLVSDADNAALYAFMMTRQPVQSHPPDNEISFPANIRFALAGWQLLFFRRGPFAADPAHDERWNRGAYLANGPGHCGACHTPRNELGAEIRAKQFDGGEVKGWHAFSISSSSQARARWNAEALYEYLRNGWHDQHGVAYGPMAPVIVSLASVPEEDVRAIAAYVAWVMGAGGASITAGAATPSGAQRAPGAAGGPRAERAPGAPAAPVANATPPIEAPTESPVDWARPATGAAIYASACAGCHNGTRRLPFGGLPLAFSTAVTGATATNLLNIILDGLHPPEGTAGAIMPGFGTTLTDRQLESLITYLRSSIGGNPTWPDVESSVREARSRQHD